MKVSPPPRVFSSRPTMQSVITVHWATSVASSSPTLVPYRRFSRRMERPEGMTVLYVNRRRWPVRPVELLQERRSRRRMCARKSPRPSVSWRVVRRAYRLVEDPRSLAARLSCSRFCRKSKFYVIVSRAAFNFLYDALLTMPTLTQLLLFRIIWFTLTIIWCVI